MGPVIPRALMYTLFLLMYIRGVIKKFLAWPSCVQNKIKIVFAFYSSKAQNTTCAVWLLSYNCLVHFSSWEAEIKAEDKYLRPKDKILASRPVCPWGLDVTINRSVVLLGLWSSTAAVSSVKCVKTNDTVREWDCRDDRCYTSATSWHLVLLLARSQGD